jgi:hypothetical protein
LRNAIGEKKQIVPSKDICKELHHIQSYERLFVETKKLLFRPKTESGRSCGKKLKDIVVGRI